MRGGLRRPRIPKGFCNKAQGCDLPRRSQAEAGEGATLGKRRPKITTLKGLRSLLLLTSHRPVGLSMARGSISRSALVAAHLSWKSWFVSRFSKAGKADR